MKLLFSNNAISSLANSITSVATTMAVSAGHGARFPQPAAGEGFYLTLFQVVNGIESNHEIVLVTARSIDTLTIVRGQDGTAARAFTSGDQVSLRATAAGMAAMAQPAEAVAFAKGASFGVTPTFPTATAGTNDTTAATTQFAKTEIANAISNLVNGAGTALDTLKELADALGGDANFATTTSTALANRVRVDTAAQGLSAAQQTNAKTNLALQNVDNTSDSNKPVSNAQQTALNLKVNNADKDASNGFPGLTGFALNLYNSVGSVKNALISYVTAARTWVMPDKSGTVALMSDVADPVVNSMNGGPLAGFRNVIINGDMRVQQRGPSANTGGITLFDRWSLNVAGANPTLSASYGQNFLSSPAGRCSVLRVNGAAGNTDSNVVQRIESVNVRHLAGQAVTLSCWVFQDTGVTRNVTFGFYYANAADNFSAFTNFAISPSTPIPSSVWTKVTCTVTLPAGAENGIGVGLMQGIGALGAGQSYSIGDVQLEPGTVATPFERRPYSVELGLCQRYYECSVFGTKIGVPGAFVSHAFSNQHFNSPLMPYRVPKRITPTVQIWATDGTPGGFTNFTANSNLLPTQFTGNLSSDRQCQFFVGGPALLTAGQEYACHWAASAEL